MSERERGKLHGKIIQSTGSFGPPPGMSPRARGAVVTDVADMSDDEIKLKIAKAPNRPKQLREVIVNVEGKPTKVAVDKIDYDGEQAELTVDKNNKGFGVLRALFSK